MMLIAVDAHSKWPEVMLMSSTTSQAPIHALRQLFATYGLPQQLVSDNEPQFSSVEFATFLARNGVKYIHSSPYHPSTNELAEHFVRILKQAMKRSNLPDPHQKLMNFSFPTDPFHTPQLTLHQVNCSFTKVSELD